MPAIDPTILNSSAYKAITPRPATNPAQAGPNCGLYALSYVMRHWYLKLQNTSRAIPQPLPARKVDVEGGVKLPKDDPNKQVSLRQLAKQINTTHPLTYLGELFSADSLVSVAKQADFDAKAFAPKSSDYLATLFKLIDANHPAIVSLDVDQDIHTIGPGKKVAGPNSGCPGQFGGEHAHWAVIVAYEWGIFWDDAVMFHWEKYFQFPAKQLRDSADQLIRFSGQTWYKPKVPTEQIQRDSSGKPLLKDGKTLPTGRGRHWQKFEPASEPRNLGLQGTPAWDHTNSRPGSYALSTQSNGQIVKTVFGNTNLNLRNVIIEVVPQGTPFA
jgi:hypothetical protein